MEGITGSLSVVLSSVKKNVIFFRFYLTKAEFVGLTLADVDMKNRKININHQLQRKRNMEYVIEDTKTSSGTRVIPMTDDVYECFKRIIANRKKPKVEPMICGKSGFLYLDKNDMPMVALHWEKYFQHICEKYNSIYKVQMQTYVLLEHGKKRNEPQDASIHHGSF